ncbi:Complex I intermediate-associated protein 84, mitochondrial [Pseudocercospora fuligena]|uniref:Complex I intermediate-associated protein 84, mitochondrial n=1 Tax=Pseudocercospora fuligena TaxID=685502 RepID=A0A8H6RHI6_9PEZI|nr:Complex I intermediate-associated protein 84, mitochondrial [Pseudocercospora fuligena]
MPSHLTRHIFRRILANEPILHRDCLRRQVYSTTRRSIQNPLRPLRHNGARNIARQQHRSFLNFGMFGAKKSNAKEADIDPGIEDMMQLAKLQRMRARLPPPEDIQEALRLFIRHKEKKKQAMSDTQAELALRALRFLSESSLNGLDSGAAGFQHLTRFETSCLSKVLSWSRTSPLLAHLEFLKYVIAITPKQSKTVYRILNYNYVGMLAHLGRTIEARQITIDIEGDHFGPEVEEPVALDDERSDRAMTAGSSDGPIPGMWIQVLKGFVLEDDEPRALETLRMLRERTWFNQQDYRIASVMLRLSINRSRLDDIRSWFAELWRSCQSRSLDRKTAKTMGMDLHRVLQWCLENDEFEFGHQAVRQATTGIPPKSVWDAIFVWAAGTGKGADEIGRMFGVMEKMNEEISDPEQWRLPDVVTINKLVEYATSKSDPYLAERFIALGQSKGIEPDAHTYQLQMEYRLKINDVDGALIAYKNLQSMDISSDKDLPTVNRLIVALCKGKRHDFDTIMNVAMDLSDRRARFEPETVSTLALLHLNRDEIHDVVDLLNTHAYHYSAADRGQIRDAVLAFCLDPSTPTSRSWDAYSVIYKIFEETPREPRTDIMKNFFARERPDMAVNVFQEMRKHSRTDTMPTVDTYVAAFLGSAKLRDLESLEVIHNQLKLDFNIDGNTYLTNALIIAYTACGQPRKAINFWNDIVSSKEGPTFNSIHIALRACEKAPFGDLKAKELWERLRKMNLDLDQSMWASYAAALAGNGDNELAFKTIEEAEASNELEVDAFLLGSLYDGGQSDSKQAEIEEWAKDKYPAVWEELERFGYDVDAESERKRFKIDRTVTP